MLNVYKTDGSYIGSLGTPDKPIVIGNIPAGTTVTQQTVIDIISDYAKILEEQSIVQNDCYILTPLFMNRVFMRFDQADRRAENDRRKRKPRNSIEWRYFGQRKRRVSKHGKSKK